MAPLDFSRSVNLISTGGRLCPSYNVLFAPPRIFKPSYGPALLSDNVGLTWKCYCSQFLWKFFIKWEVLQTHAEHNWRVKPFAFPNGIPLRNLFPIFSKFWWHSSTGQISTLVGRIRWGILPDLKKNSWNFMCKKYDEFAWIEGRRSSDLYIQWHWTLVMYSGLKQENVVFVVWI